MIPKSKGAEDSCPSCHQVLVCREKEYKGEVSLQWQYKDKEEAHFSFDYKTKKTSCKESSTSETTVRPTSARTIDLDSLSIPKDQQEHIIKSSEEMAERMFCVLKGVQNAAAKVGETNPAGIGMVYNQVCENRRSE
jgi:hypothetical protein